MLIFQLTQLYHLDSHKLASKLMNRQIHLSKCTIAYFLDKLVKIQTRWWKFLVLSHILPIIFYNFITFFHYFFVQLLVLAFVDMFLPLVNRTRSYSCCGVHTVCLLIRLLSTIPLGLLLQQLLHSISGLFFMGPSSLLLGLLYKILIYNYIITIVLYPNIGIDLQIYCRVGLLWLGIIIKLTQFLLLVTTRVVLVTQLR